MNKKGGAKIITAAIIILVVLVAVVAVYYITSDMKKSETAEEIRIKSETDPTIDLTGKPATIKTYALDAGNTDKTTKAPADLYIITDPVITSDKITGGFAEDGTALSATARTSITGLTVGTKFAAIATNATYFGFPTAILEAGKVKSGTGYSLGGLGQGQTLDIDVYKTAPALSLKIWEDNTEVTVGGNRNLSVGANQDMVPDELRFEMNLTNVAVNLAGFYIDVPVGTNITNIVLADDATGLSESNLNLKHTEADNYVFMLDTPVLMDAWDKLTLENAIKMTGDATGCGTGDDDDLVTFYVMDKVWVKSSDTSAMIYDVQSDAASPTDIGMTDHSLAFNCGENA